MLPHPDPSRGALEEHVDESTGLHEGGEAAVNPARGVDADPERRPGVPMEHAPSQLTGAHWETPSRQPNADGQLHRVELDRPTPIVGTAQPPRGLSGAMRRSAYRIPEHFARHWLLLMLADRVDVVEDRVGRFMGQPLRRAGLNAPAERLAAHPLAALAGLAAGVWLLKRLR